MRRSVAIFLLMGAVAGAGPRAFGQTFVEIQQDATAYNLQSTNGVPISDTPGVPPGSDGRAPKASDGPLGTVNQFQSVITFGGLVVPANRDLLDGSLSYARNAENLDLPRAKIGTETQVIMLRARIGAPYLSRRVSFLFGAIIPVPDVDEYGVPLKAANTNVVPNRPPTDPDRYWASEPYTETDHSGRGYYWSVHARRVFAINPGPLPVVWRKALPSTPVGSPQNVATVTIAGSTYTVFTNRYIVSGSAVKPPRQMYWTEGDFVRTGKRIEVPTARVGGMQIVYNSSFPERVAEAYPQSSHIEPDATNRLDETRTLWFDHGLGSIHAYNAEGRIFLELLGDLREDKVSRQHLGFEIVDVTREPTPHDVAVELGERLTAFEGGNPDDSDLFPEPIPNPAQSFAYQHNINGTERVEFYAARETANLNDLQVHWMEEGLAGLKWPSRFVRYSLDWPKDVAEYSHYIRPLVQTEAEARETAVPLPNQNAPIIQYQDPLDQVRGKLTERFEYYTFLSPEFPAHRALLRFSSGEHVRFERVFSWLDATLRSGDFADSVAGELSSWDTNSNTFNWPDHMITPRVEAQTAMVGERINAPAGEMGTGLDEEYLSGHIVQETGDSFHPGAYKDPFIDGFETANLGAIIPVNAIPGDNLLEVMWFRKNQVDTARNFTNTLWPAVIARYTLQWPTDSGEIVLASNDGSGPLPSLEANGSIYFQNDASLPGYNPNEEHALMQGGQAYALRDDLNITAQPNYSSDPMVLIDYVAEDGRPAIRLFKVVRENPSEGVTFTFDIQAGTILQPPMPLPMIEKPFAPRVVGQQLHSVNEEVSSWTVTGSTSATADGIEFSTLSLSATPIFPSHLQLVLQGTAAEMHRFFVTEINAGTKSALGIVFDAPPAQLSRWTISAQPAEPNRWKYSLDGGTNPGVDAAVLLAAPDRRSHWAGTVREQGTEAGAEFVVVEFPAARPAEAENAPLLIVPASGADFANYLLSAEVQPAGPEGTIDIEKADFTFQDRKGNQWVYRGPHLPSSQPVLFAQFYYKTLPGFYFPTLALDAQPPAGTITPYLRAKLPDGTYLGDAVHGNANNDQAADGNALGITYLPQWPDSTPVLEMAETLMTPKRGLPAVRGQTSLEVLYQQSQVEGGPLARSVVLHDPTREKQFDLDEDPASTMVLGAIPDSVATSSYRGKLYFPQLPPHLAERFFLDPNRGENGALVFHGLFVDAPLGDKYVHLNVLGTGDLSALKELCKLGDPKRGLWDAAIDGLSTEMELFVEDPGQQGRYIPFDSATATIGPLAVAEVTDEDVAVDSYALTAVGPGTGYVTLVAGNGRAFTPEADPVSLHIIRVVNTLYRGEVNVVESSNPLNEKLTMQQVVDLAGLAQDYNFEWKIAAPVDGLPPTVYENTARTLLTDGTWSHLLFPLAGEGIGTNADDRTSDDVVTAVTAVSLIPFGAVTKETDRYHFDVSPPHRLVAGNEVVMRTEDGQEFFGTVHGSSTASLVVVAPEASASSVPVAGEIIQLYERVSAERPQSIVSREFNVPAGTYSQVWLSMDLDDTLGARVYIDGQLLVRVNTGTDDTATTTAPDSLTPLSRTYLLPPVVLAGGAVEAGGSKLHEVVAEVFSTAQAGIRQLFNVRLEAFESVDVTTAQWLPMDTVRFEDGVRAVLGGQADVRSLSDNYVIMRYQAKDDSHASWISDPLAPEQNIGWSQWTSPQLAEGWIKRVLKGINPFNQRVTDLFNNQVNTDVSIVQQAGPRWEGDVALNLETINDAGLIEIYETVLNRGKMLSIDGGINYGPANDALLLAAGYLNDLYMIVGNEAWADAANPTIGIGTKDNTYGDIATALFAFRGQVPTVLEEELALLRGRDDFLLPGVELRPLYNRLPWNFTRGIDAGEVIYSLNYNILDQNTDGVVDAVDAQTLFPQGHGDAYGHYLTALKGYYTLLINPNFDWVPRIEAVTVLGKPVSVDYQDERKFAAAAAALARAGKQTFDLTWRRDYQSGSGIGWEHLSETKENTTTRNLPTTRYWGMDHWASRTGQGAYLNWIVGNAILPDEDPDPAHEGSIQQVDRTTVPELKELPAIAESLQTAMDNAEGRLTPLGIPANTIPFDLNPLSIANGQNTAHFEQIYERAREALNNAVAAFDDAKDVTRLMRSEQDSLEDFQTEVEKQELAYNNSLLELYGSPYPEDIGPGRTFDTGYAGPDVVHYMYVDNKELTFPGLLEPKTNKIWRIDIQTFTPDWLGDNHFSDFSFIEKARTLPVDGIAEPTEEYLEANAYVEYTLDSHGFFQKPELWAGRRATPGRIQQAISDIMKARNAAFEAFYKADSAKNDLDWAIGQFEQKRISHNDIHGWKVALRNQERIFNGIKIFQEVVDKALDATSSQISKISLVARTSIPRSLIAGLAAGGDLTAPARGGVLAGTVAYESVFEWKKVVSFALIKANEYLNELNKGRIELNEIAPEEWHQEQRETTTAIRDKVYGVNNQLMAINNALQELDDAQRAYQGLLAEGERVQAEREVFRQRAAAVIQGFRTRDAAFRIFRNEKLERYKTLFDLAAQYTFMAAQAYDYDTGLLHTQQGREFINRIIRARALGVMADGEPQFAGSNTGDPGLSSVMAEMKAEWSVLKGRLGIKNPDAYGTTASLRFENFRILPGAEGDSNWKDVLIAGRRANILEDSDVGRYCMQIDPGNGLPVPGIILEFSTTIADGLNLFGQSLAPGDHSFSPASFATKIFGAGVAFEGYKGMDDPVANGSAIDAANGASPADPSLVFLDPDAMAANPYVYLVPVGLDSMRSPPLGDVSVIRTWSVDDVAIPLPFNIGGSGFSTAPVWQSGASLTEPIFTVRKYQPFRPVSSAQVFGTLVVYWTGGELERTQYNNTRLLGRSVWNSKWKLVIPGRTLLNDPNDGLDRFIRSVDDVKLYFMTYSYAGN